MRSHRAFLRMAFAEYICYNTSMQKSLKIIGAISIALLAAAFAYWAFTTAYTMLGIAVGALSCFLFGMLLLRILPRAAELFTQDARPFPDDAFGARTLRRARRHPWLKIAAFAILVRVLLYGIAYFVFTWQNGYSGGIIDTLREMWLRTDSPSYLGIAENWYVTKGDSRFHLVFFPLYPLCIRALNFLVKDSFASAMLVSNGFAVASAIACYELTALEMPFNEAKSSVRYMLLLPAAFFLGAPMTESLFLFLSLITLYLARRRKFLLGCITAALAGFSRLPGILLAIPVAAEMAAELCERYRKKDGFKSALFKRLAALCILPLGLFAYLYINYSVSGNAFTFLTYQREHWQQSMTFFFSASAYQAEYALSQTVAMRNQIFVPNLIACFGALYLMLRAVKEMRASYSLYFLAYFAITTGASWLLSAPRYLTVAYPLILACTLRAREPSKDILLTVILSALLIAYMSMYVLGGFVY